MTQSVVYVQVCFGCPRGFPQNTVIDSALCADCPHDDTVQPVITEAEWRDLERHIYERENEQIARELESFQPSQGSVNAERIEQPQRKRGQSRKVWRGRRNE